MWASSGESGAGQAVPSIRFFWTRRSLHGKKTRLTKKGSFWNKTAANPKAVSNIW
jgi:hypothetical protein